MRALKWSTIAVILLESGLLYFLLIRGVIPGLTRIDTDFPNYYTAGKIVLSGDSVNRLYDDAWFQGRIDAEGIHQQGKFSPFPPITALLCAPLGLFSPLEALRIVTVLNLIAIAAGVILIALLAGASRSHSLLLVLLSGVGLTNCLRFGQVYVALSVSLILGYYLYRKHRPILAGICFGLWIPVKYFPVALLLWFVLKKEWRFVLASILSAGLLVLIGVIVLGWNIHAQFLTSVLGGHLNGELSLQSPFSPAFQSFSSLYHSLFLQDSVLHPDAPFPSTLGYWLFTWLTLWAIVGFTIWVVFRLRHVDEDGRISLALLSLATLLAAPATATYHAVLLWLGGALLYGKFRNDPRLWPKVFLGVLYASIGWLPYSVLLRFYDHGVLTLLAYPRLLIFVTMFATIIVSVREVDEDAPSPVQSSAV